MTATMERTWTEIGKPHAGEMHARIANLIDRMDWKPFGAGASEGMMPAMGIMETVKQLHLPKTSRYAIAGNDNPCFGLYGIECQYKNGKVRVYVMDLGSEIVPVCSDFWPNEDR